MKNKIILTAVLAVFQMTILFAQQRTVSGQVSSEADGMPLPGVNVLVKGTNQGTVTDFDGNYSIDVNEGAVLVFSSLGFERREVTVGNQSTIDVRLQEDLESLEEVVVTSFGIEREKKAQIGRAHV